MAAHQLDKGLVAAPGSAEAHLASGNDWADTEAKAARRADHPSWSRAQETELERHLQGAKVTLEVAMVALKRWPRVGQLERKGMAEAEVEARRQRQEQRRQQRQDHEDRMTKERRKNKASHQWCTWHQTKR